MADSKTHPVRIQPEARAALEGLQLALKAEGLPKPTQQELVSAMILWTSAPMAAGMLSRYLRDAASSEPADA
jgi:hypothetical protein